MRYIICILSTIVTIVFVDDLITLSAQSYFYLSRFRLNFISSGSQTGRIIMHIKCTQKCIKI
jgi:hypothetical protein